MQKCHILLSAPGIKHIPYPKLRVTGLSGEKYQAFYIGCFKDAEDRAMFQKYYHDDMTIKWCMEKCYFRAVSFFGLEVGLSVNGKKVVSVVKGTFILF